jgi:hypothetical protein
MKPEQEIGLNLRINLELCFQASNSIKEIREEE